MKERRTSTPVIIGEITIIPLEEVVSYGINVKGRLSIYYSKEPIGIAISSPQGKWAIDVYGGQISLDTCIEEVPGLQQVLDNLSD